MKPFNRKNKEKLAMLISYFKQIIRIVDHDQPTDKDLEKELGARFAPLSQADQNAMNAPADAAEAGFGPPEHDDKVIVIGASFGGTRALYHILGDFPVNCPPTLIVQHMPAGALKAFTQRLDKTCHPEVRLAQDGDVPRSGLVLVAPGGAHMILKTTDKGAVVRLYEETPVNNQRPSIDILFHSAAKALGGNAVGVLLTGMGRDGVNGLSHMRASGSHTLAQNKATSDMYSMPGAAVERGAVRHVLALERIASTALSLARNVLTPEERLQPLQQHSKDTYIVAN